MHPSGGTTLLTIIRLIGADPPGNEGQKRSPQPETVGAHWDLQNTRMNPTRKWSKNGDWGLY